MISKSSIASMFSLNISQDLTSFLRMMNCFLISLLLKFRNSLGCFYFVLQSCDSDGICQYRNLQHLQKFLLIPFQHTKVLNDMATNVKNRCYIVQPQNWYYHKNTLCNYPSLMTTLRFLHCTNHTFAVLLSHY